MTNSIRVNFYILQYLMWTSGRPKNTHISTNISKNIRAGRSDFFSALYMLISGQNFVSGLIVQQNGYKANR